MRAAACFLEAGHSIQRAASHAASRSNVVIMANDNTAFVIVILFAFIVFAFLVVNVGLYFYARKVFPPKPPKKVGAKKKKREAMKQGSRQA